MTIRTCVFAALISYIKEQLAGGYQVVVDQGTYPPDSYSEHSWFPYLVSG